MSKPDAPKFVTALFSFKGKNNDELCFKKGDLITITQTDDEGWWEGTLQDKTGWFPSNYVKESRLPESGLSSVKASPEKVQPESPVHLKLNREIVLKDIIDSERVNVAELQGLANSFLLPLESANILKKEEYKQLLGNIQEVLETHQRLLVSLEAAVSQNSASRIGNLFLTLAPRLKTIHTTYCSNHPRAVCILDRYRDELNEFMERSGAISPGILVLTTGLSKPFRRLDKYSAMLQELERHTEKNHSDRGDTQRSIAVYREIADRCASIRKQRELALQVLTSGIKGWEGEELSSLGEILHVGSVTLATGAFGPLGAAGPAVSPGATTIDRRDRYFVLFSTTLLVLSTSPRMSSFVYEGKLPLTGITVTVSEDTEEVKNAFEITGPMIESIVVLCATKEDRQRWIEFLIQEQASGLLRSPSMPRVSYTQPPYSRLSRYFAKLVKRKIIRPELMKKLLYLQYVLKPDLSNVQMRKPNVTVYALYPARSSSLSGDSDASEAAAAAEPEVVTPEKPRVLRKSTLSLDVKYAVPDIDLSTVGRASGSSLADSQAVELYESSKSLPSSGRYPRKIGLLVANSSRSTDLYPLSFPSARDPRDPRDQQVRRNRLDASKELARPGDLPITGNNEAPKMNIQGTRERRGLDSRREASVHSSDSGMAESCRFNSSYTCTSTKYNAAPARSSFSESETDENKFENQCICTSPFGSTPRDSAHLSDVARTVDESSESLNRGLNLDSRPIRENAALPRKRFTQPIPCHHRSVVRKIGRKAIQPFCPSVEEVDSKETTRIYTSGLYAHWWLKKPIPFSGCTEQAMLCEVSFRFANIRDALRSRNASRVTPIRFIPLSMSKQTSNQSNGKQHQQHQQHQQHPQRTVGEHQCSSPGIKTPWSVASLRPAPPLYSLKTFGKQDVTLDLSRTPRACNERQFEEDAIILKVIEGYCLSVNARFTVHSGESNPVLDYDSHKVRDRVSLAQNRGNWDSCNNRTLSETVKTLKSQMTDLQSQMSLLTKQLDEERRSRLSLAATVKRSMGVVDSSIP